MTPTTVVHCMAALCLLSVPGAGCDKPAPPPRAEPTLKAAAAPSEKPPDADVANPVADQDVSAAPKPAPPQAAGLEYVEIIFGGGAPNEPLPMIVAIHGLGDTPENFAHVFDGWTGTARLILPRGVDAFEEGGFSWFPTRARSADVDALATGISESAKKIAAAIGELAEKRPTLGKPTVTGFSQGGMLTFAIAVAHPEVVGHAVAVGGWLPPPLWPTAKPTGRLPKLTALHGTSDSAVPFAPTAAAVAHLTGLGFVVELKSYEGVGHAIPPPVQQDLFAELGIASVAAHSAAAQGTKSR